MIFFSFIRLTDVNKHESLIKIPMGPILLLRLSDIFKICD